MVRAVASRTPPASNEDLAIVNFNPLPGNAMNFLAVRDVMEDFLEEHARVSYKDIQPSHLGQALVRFTNVYDCDNLIRMSPIPFGDVSVSFVKHNRARNWRRVLFNTECWIMLLGFPADYWEEEFVQNAIGSFGRITHWKPDRRYLTRLIIRARVIDLLSVPHFIVYSENPGFEGESWTVQCEVLQGELLGVGRNLRTQPLSCLWLEHRLISLGLDSLGRGLCRI
jgi:hypothetical protein